MHYRLKSVITEQIKNGNNVLILKFKIADISNFRLSVARDLGATHTVLVSKQDSAACIFRNVCDVIGGQAFDCVIECSGAPVCIEAAVTVTLIVAVAVSLRDAGGIFDMFFSRASLVVSWRRSPSTLLTPRFLWRRSSRRRSTFVECSATATSRFTTTHYNQCTCWCCIGACFQLPQSHLPADVTPFRVAPAHDHAPIRADTTSRGARSHQSSTRGRRQGHGQL